MPNAIEETDPLDTAALLPSADSGPSPTTFNTSALPDPEDPQATAATDALQVMPDDPSQTAAGIDIFQDMPDAAQHSINADMAHVLPDTEVSLHTGITETYVVIGTGGTTQPQVTTTTTTNQGFPQGATPTFPPHIIKPTLPPYSTTTPSQPLPFGTTEPDPPRGDSI